MIRRPRSTKVLLDVLLSVLGMILLLINEPLAEDLTPKVDYVLDVSWTEGLNIDIDTHVLLPNGQQASYRNKDTGYVSIDRDDLGHTNDPAPQNQELTSFRGLEDGLYYVSIRNYANHEGRVDPEWRIDLTLREIGEGIIHHEFVRIPEGRYEEDPVFKFFVENGKITDIQPSERKIVQ